MVISVGESLDGAEIEARPGAMAHRVSYRRRTLNSMNARLLPQILLRQTDSPQTDLDLATDGMLRYGWSSQWADMLIEARGGVVYVNGQRVGTTPAPKVQC